jgi:fructose-bisphosphate aldolase class II
MSKLKLKPGVITGTALQDLFAYMKDVEAALPAVNVIGSHTVNAALAAARDAKCPIIVQLSHGGAHFYAGKFLDNSNHQASVMGAIAGAHHVRVMAESYGVPIILHTDHCAKKLLPWVDGMLDHGERYFERHGEPLFSSHMLDLSEEPLEENLEVCADRLRRMNKINMTLEIELGVTGGEEDGIDNSDIDESKLYTQPSEVLASYDVLHPIGNFTVAAAFGNTHGVYKPGNVKLRPKILRDSQAAVQAERGTASHEPIDFVFHGGSGSSKEEIHEAVSYGVIKMNIDTDTQWAFTHPIKAYMDNRDGYLQTQIGNPDGADKPNKKHIDPRSWVHLGEKAMAARLVEALEDLGALGKFDF